jgi:hypothetical protein
MVDISLPTNGSTELNQLFTCSHRADAPEMGQAVVTRPGPSRFCPEAKTWPRLLASAPRPAHATLNCGHPRLCRTAERHEPAQIAAEPEFTARRHETGRRVICCIETSPFDATAGRHCSTLAAWLFATTGEVVTEVM